MPQFYEALVEPAAAAVILTPHEGPGAAMAAGYVKASGQPCDRHGWPAPSG